MSTSIRSLPSLYGPQAIAVLNALRLDLIKLRSGVIFHADANPAVVVPAATDLPTSVTALAALCAAYVVHIASACSATTGQGAHIAADVTDVFTTPAGTDLATSEARVNEFKTLFNVHIASTAYHAAADSTNTIATANATNLATLEALVNASITALNAHMAAAFTHQATALVAP